MRTQTLGMAARRGLLGVAVLMGLASSAHAQSATMASDRGAGFIVFPKIVADPLDAFNRGQTTETIVQLTNLDPTTARRVHCFYVNATGVCAGGAAGGNAIGGPDCRSDDDCASNNCDTEIWGETNFTITLTAQQPTGWNVSEVRDVDDVNGEEGVGEGRIFSVPTDYFQGDLKCVEVGNSVNVLPINRNDLKGEATTYVVSRDPNDPNAITSVDVRRYNAIGFQAASTNGQEQSDRNLCLGGNGIDNDDCENAEYAPCPEKLIVNHLFDGAGSRGFDSEPSVTLVPCTQRLAEDIPTAVTAQMLVFNEFEQRFSLSERVECYRELLLRDVSILYEAGVQGTFAGQTIFRGVAEGDPADGGFGILGIAENNTDVGSTAYNVIYSGVNANTADVVNYVLTDQN